MEYIKLKNFENKYLINVNGEIVSISRKHWNGRCWWTSKEKKLKHQVSKSGYKTIALSIGNGKIKTSYVHRLIAEHFIPNSDNKPQVNHIDGNKLNNSLNNLEWVTVKENITHAFETGLNKGIKRFGERNNSAKLTKKDILKIRSLKGKKMIKELANDYEVSVSQISAIQNYKSWKHIK